MSGGYTPVFNSALDGTLYGKWPHTGVWLCLLSQCDWRGNIDVVPKLLAAKIGVSEEVLMDCIADFMQPDPGSRTGDLEGRRLELIDPASRNWGWRVVNHGIYNEKARKKAHDAARVEDGRNKARMAARKANWQNTEDSSDPRRPDETRDDPLSSPTPATTTTTTTSPATDTGRARAQDRPQGDPESEGSPVAAQPGRADAQPATAADPNFDSIREQRRAKEQRTSELRWQAEEYLEAHPEFDAGAVTLMEFVPGLKMTSARTVIKNHRKKKSRTSGRNGSHLQY